MHPSICATELSREQRVLASRNFMKNEIIRVGQIEIKFLLEAADTNGAVAMFEFTVLADARVPLPHSHKLYDETIYGVAGVLTFTVEERAVPIGPGECCFIPRGAVH